MKKLSAGKSEAMKHLRFVILIIITLVSAAIYLIRTSLNAAIVYMVPAINESEKRYLMLKDVDYFSFPGSDIFSLLHQRQSYFRNGQENSTGGNDTCDQGSGGYFNQLAKQQFNYTHAQQ